MPVMPIPDFSLNSFQSFPALLSDTQAILAIRYLSCKIKEMQYIHYEAFYIGNKLPQ
jgi:hypothetical protein